MVKGTKKLFGFITAGLLATLMAVTAIVTLIAPKQVFAVDAAGNYVETEFGEGEFLITTEDSTGKKYYLPTTAATNSGPKKVEFENVDDIGEEHLWTVEATDTSGQYYIKSGENYLYTTSSNSGVRIAEQTSPKAWKYNSSDNSLQYTGTSRYLGVYVTGSDWRSYTTVTQGNYKGTSQAFKFYKLNETTGGDEELSPIETALNEVNAYMSLAYKYTATSKTVETSGEVVDALNISKTGVTSGSTTYEDWIYEASKTSGAKYVGQSAGSHDSIQLRSNNSNSGIVTTVSGGKATKIVVTWNSNTTNGRTLNVYGKNTAYSATTDLYNTSNQGTLIGTIVCGTSTVLEITDEYAYIGLRSNSGAMYLSKVEITWDSGESGTKTETVLENSEFRIRCGVDASLLAIADVEEFGISVTANGKTKEYTDEAVSWTKDEVNGVVYVIVSLGDIINDVEKLTTEFTVQAYVTAGGITYVSELSKTYSVVDMVKEYKDLGVDHLYNYLLEKNIIKEGA